MSPSLRLCSLLPLALLFGCLQPGRSDEPPRDRLLSTWATGPQHFRGAAGPGPEVSLSLFPMYGGVEMDRIRDISPDLREFVRALPHRPNVRRQASDEAALEGIDYYLQDRYAASMMRLNEAWLLNNENPQAFLGFALLYADAKNFHEASLYAELAVTLGLTSPTGRADAALFMALGEEQRGAASGTQPTTDFVSRIQGILDDSARRATSEGQAYVARNRLLAMGALGQEDLAWEAAKELESMGEIPPEIWIGMQTRRARMGLSN